MLKIGLFVIYMGLLSTSSFANLNCEDYLAHLEKELESCEISYQENASTADMNEASYKAGDCAIKVGNQIFETYYMTTAEDSKKLFDSHIRQIYAFSHHLYQGSDFSQKFNNGTMYNTMAITESYFAIKELVKKYLKEMKNQCGEAKELNVSL